MITHERDIHVDTNTSDPSTPILKINESKQTSSQGSRMGLFPKNDDDDDDDDKSGGYSVNLIPISPPTANPGGLTPLSSGDVTLKRLIPHYLLITVLIATVFIVGQSQPYEQTIVLHDPALSHPYVPQQVSSEMLQAIILGLAIFVFSVSRLFGQYLSLSLSLSISLLCL